MKAFFATDLHGRRQRYTSLVDRVLQDKPGAVFLGGDLLPFPAPSESDGSLIGPTEIIELFRDVSRTLGANAPDIFLILGNDDPREYESLFVQADRDALLHYLHNTTMSWNNYTVMGYACIPPSPFLLKDWERYDVSRFVPPGCVSPEEGFRSVRVESREVRYGTISKDLDRLANGITMTHAICLFHSPPHETSLDRADLDGQSIDHVPLDVNIGSIAIRRFIEEHQPLVTLHGHVHESARLTGNWRDRIGRTHLLGGAHDGQELSLIVFDTDQPDSAERLLL